MREREREKERQREREKERKKEREKERKKEREKERKRDRERAEGVQRKAFQMLRVRVTSEARQWMTNCEHADTHESTRITNGAAHKTWRITNGRRRARCPVLVLILARCVRVRQVNWAVSTWTHSYTGA